MKLFEQWCLSQHLPLPKREYRFHPKRRWRFDYAWPDQKIALEVEGGAFLPGGGRHTRGAGFRKDLEKYNTAVAMGWRVFRVLPEQLLDPEVGKLIRTALDRNSNTN